MVEWIAHWIHKPDDPGSQLGGSGTVSTELHTECHHGSIGVERLLRVLKVWKGFLGRVRPKTLNG